MCRKFLLRQKRRSRAVNNFDHSNLKKNGKCEDESRSWPVRTGHRKHRDHRPLWTRLKAKVWRHQPEKKNCLQLMLRYCYSEVFPWLCDAVL